MSRDPKLVHRTSTRAQLLVGAAAAMAALAMGCASSPSGASAGGLRTAGSLAKREPATMAPAPTAEAAAKQDGYRPGSEPCDLESVFFGFDESGVSSSGESTLRQVVRCMRDSGVQRIQLTGHTDNRGTEAYNFALADRRARAVKAALVRLGVPAGSISIASAGEEWACGEDEAGWASDRRVDVTAR